MSKTREALEGALRENPDDLAAAMAWADHAAEEGDPRGEFAQVQIALEDPNLTPAQREELAGRERDLLRRHRSRWLGKLRNCPVKAIRFRFARGWLHTIEFTELTAPIVTGLAENSCAAILRCFGADRVEIDPSTGMPMDFAGVEKLPFLRSLQRFRLGQMYQSLGDLGAYDPEPLFSQMTSLEHLEIYARGTWFRVSEAINWSRLRSLHVHHHKNYPLAQLGRNASLRNLQTIEFFAHALMPGDERAYICEAEFVPFAHSPHITHLRHLSLLSHEIGDTGVIAMIDSGLLGRLETLELSFGNLTDRAAIALAGSDQLGQLVGLRLDENYLSAAGVRRLRATSIPVEAAGMYDLATLEQRHHLRNGDRE